MTDAGKATVGPIMCSRCGEEPACAAGCATWDGPVCNTCSYKGSSAVNTQLCGSFGCTLPRGHNRGHADVPSNHQVRARVDAHAAEVRRCVEQAAIEQGREGMVTVYDHEGRYLGCMGIETWRNALEQEPRAPVSRSEYALTPADRAQASAYSWTHATVTTEAVADPKKETHD